MHQEGPHRHQGRRGVDLVCPTFFLLPLTRRAAVSQLQARSLFWKMNRRWRRACFESSACPQGHGDRHFRLPPLESNGYVDAHPPAKRAVPTGIRFDSGSLRHRGIGSEMNRNHLRV